jgi:hypothetical protein
VDDASSSVCIAAVSVWKSQALPIISAIDLNVKATPNSLFLVWTRPCDAAAETTHA